MLNRRLFSMLSNIGSRPKSSSISTAAMLVIGDEVLNGKIKDTNSQYFAQYCFELGIDLRRISVVPDETSEIVEVLNALRSKFDFIITTGGIGPTHDDITYESIAEAFGLPLKLDSTTVDKMNELSQNPPKAKTPGSEELEAQLRMARFPEADFVTPMFVSPNFWVPIVNLDDQVYIFPGIPSIYRQLLEGLREHIAARVDGPKMSRRYVSTTTPESQLAGLLGSIHKRYADQKVKIGSYPHYNDKRNTISILGPENGVLESIVQEVLPKVDNGREVTADEEAASS